MPDRKEVLTRVLFYGNGVKRNRSLSRDCLSMGHMWSRDDDYRVVAV